MDFQQGYDDPWQARVTALGSPGDASVAGVMQLQRGPRPYPPRSRQMRPLANSEGKARPALWHSHAGQRREARSKDLPAARAEHQACVTPGTGSLVPFGERHLYFLIQDPTTCLQLADIPMCEV